MPQKPYMFLGTLKDQLLYPNVKEWTSKFTGLGLEYERAQLSIHGACFSLFLLDGEKLQTNNYHSSLAGTASSSTTMAFAAPDSCGGQSLGQRQDWEYPAASEFT